MIIETKRNTALVLAIPMVDAATPASFETGLAPAVDAYYHDGAGWQALAIAGSVAEIGATGVYSLPLSAGELDHDRVIVKLTAAGAADTMVDIRTHTNALDDLAAGSLDTLARKMVTNNRSLDVATGVETVMDDDGATPLATITPAEAVAGTATQTVAVL